MPIGINAEHPLAQLVGRFVQSMRDRRDDFQAAGAIPVEAAVQPTTDPYAGTFGSPVDDGAQLAAANAGDDLAAVGTSPFFDFPADPDTGAAVDPYAIPFGYTPDTWTPEAQAEHEEVVTWVEEQAAAGVEESREAYEECLLDGGTWEGGRCTMPDTTDDQADDLVGQEDTTPGLLLPPAGDPLGGASGTATFARLALAALVIGGAAWGVSAYVKRKRKRTRRRKR